MAAAGDSRGPRALRSGHTRTEALPPALFTRRNPKSALLCLNRSELGCSPESASGVSLCRGRDSKALGDRWAQATGGGGASPAPGTAPPSERLGVRAPSLRVSSDGPGVSSPAAPEPGGHELRVRPGCAERAPCPGGGLAPRRAPRLPLQTHGRCRTFGLITAGEVLPSRELISSRIPLPGLPRSPQRGF